MPSESPPSQVKSSRGLGAVRADREAALALYLRAVLALRESVIPEVNLQSSVKCGQPANIESVHLLRCPGFSWKPPEEQGKAVLLSYHGQLHTTAGGSIHLS